VDRAAQGEEVVIKRRGRRLAQLVAMPERFGDTDVVIALWDKDPAT